MGFIIRETTKSDAYDVATVHVRSWQSAYRNTIPDSFLDGMNIENKQNDLSMILMSIEERHFTMLPKTMVGS